MSRTLQLSLAQSPQGRIYLHFLCTFRDHKLISHIKGVQREFKKLYHDFLHDFLHDFKTIPSKIKGV